MDIRKWLGCALGLVISFGTGAREGVLDQSFLYRGWSAPFVSVGGTLSRSQTFYDAGIDSTGRVIAIGSAQDPVGTNSDCHVLITTPDSRDFQHFRRVALNRGGDNVDLCAAIDVMADDSLLVSGYATTAGNRFTGIVTRLASDGAIDTSFFDNGVFEVNTQIPWIDPTDQSILISSKLDLQGRLLTLGRTQRADGTLRGLLLRFNADGSLDTGFGVDGAVSLADFNPPRVNTSALTLSPDGLIYVAGSTDNPGLPRQTVIFRLHDDGALDLSFGAGMNGVSGNGGGGRGFTGRCDRIGGLALDSSNRLLLGCEPDASGATPGPILAPGVLRLDPSGQPDPTFGNNGLVELLSFSSSQGTIQGPPRIALATDGRIIVAGTLSVADQAGNPTDWYITQLDSTGIANGNFGYQNGRSRLRLGDPQGPTSDAGGERVTHLLLDARGRPIIVGTLTSSTDSQFLIGRLGMADPAVASGFLDPDFNFGFGFVTNRFGQVAGERRDLVGIAVAQNAGGRITSVGRIQLETNPVTSLCTVSRVLASGAIDTSFNGTGRRTLSLSPSSENPGLCLALLAQDDDSTLIAGFVAESATLMRLLPNGQVDTSFFGNGALETWTDLNFQAGNIRARFRAIQRDSAGRILLAGETTEPGPVGDENFGIVLRLRADLSIDTSFGDQGIARLNTFTNPRRLSIRSVVVNADGLIYVTAVEGNEGSGNIGPAVYRLLDTGMPDASWVGGGYARLRAHCGFGTDNGAAVDTLQGLLLVCYQAAPGTPSGVRIGVLRLLPNGQPDLNFGDAGVATVRFISINDNAGTTDRLNHILPTTDGKIIVVGSHQNQSPEVRDRHGSFNIGVQRLLGNGAPDSSAFGTQNAANLFRLPAYYGLFRTTPLGAFTQSDGRVLIIGVQADERLGVPVSDRDNQLLIRVSNVTAAPPPPLGDDVFSSGFE